MPAPFGDPLELLCDLHEQSRAWLARLPDPAPDSRLRWDLAQLHTALNEERLIAAVIDEIKAQANGFDVLVIDDGSTDRTAELARARGAAVVRHPFNMGYGVALQTGEALFIANEIVRSAEAVGLYAPSATWI